MEIGICHGALQGKKDFADVIQLRILKKKISLDFLFGMM